eukprot:236226-Karenia_brevis.AAC.1
MQQNYKKALTTAQEAEDLLKANQQFGTENEADRRLLNNRTDISQFIFQDVGPVVIATVIETRWQQKKATLPEPHDTDDARHGLDEDHQPLPA